MNMPGVTAHVWESESWLRQSSSRSLAAAIQRRQHSDAQSRALRTRTYHACHLNANKQGYIVNFQFALLSKLIQTIHECAERLVTSSRIYRSDSQINSCWKTSI